MTERVVYCPGCGARYDVARAVVAEEGLVLLCGACGHAARVTAFRGEGPVADAIPCAHAVLSSAAWPRIVVGHEVPAAARSVAAVLRAAQLAPVLVRSGDQVLAACDPAMPELPAAVVLDVAVPGVLAFEVIEQLRAHPVSAHIPVILLASVFERTRYKRKVTNLYGADAYLELHHVPDRLAALVRSLVDHEPMPMERLQAPVERARAAGLRGRPDGADDDVTRTWARRILSDVVLYHGDEVAQGVRRGAPFSALGPALDAARELFLACGPHAAVFEHELETLVARLLERDAMRRQPQVATNG